jgi:hypothetical protein
MNRAWAWPAALAVLAVEAAGGIAFAVLTVVLGSHITPGFIPWASAAPPGLFGVFCLVAAVLLWLRRPVGRWLAAVAQLLVILGAVNGMLSGYHPSLWIALFLGLGGLVLVLLTPPPVR